VGAGLGPLVTGLMTEHLFGGPMGLGRSLALLAVLTLPTAAVTLWLSLKAVCVTAQRLLPEPAMLFVASNEYSAGGN
jgi:hypothetical protein